MSKRYSLLIIGNPYDGHLVRFVTALKNINPNISIDVFGKRIDGKELPSDLSQLADSVYLTDFKLRFKGINGLYLFEQSWKFKKCFHKYLGKNKYDVVDIHYPTFADRYLLRDIRKISNKLVLTPWGSDVYRISERQRKIVKKLYDAADYVTGNGLRFTKDFMRIYSIPDRKLRCLSLGSDDIDYFIEHRNDYNTEEAKKLLGIDDHYVITCGYNGNPAQQHEMIIEAINRIKTKLPTNLLLLFPFTYGGSKDYLEHIKNKVKELGFDAYYSEKYLDLKGLFLLRQATDMFVHVQATDANNGSLKQYVWFGKNVVHGGWIGYDDIEAGGDKPYHTTPSMDKLSETIIKAYQEGPVVVKEETRQIIERYGYNYLAPRWNEMFESIIE